VRPPAAVAPLILLAAATGTGRGGEGGGHEASTSGGRPADYLQQTFELAARIASGSGSTVI